MTLDAKIPSGPLAQKWERHKFESKLIYPVGSGLASETRAALNRLDIRPRWKKRSEQR